MPETTKTLKERLEKQGMEMLALEMELDAAREQLRNLDVRLWEAEQVVAAYRAVHTQEPDTDTERDTEE